MNSIRSARTKQGKPWAILKMRYADSGPTLKKPSSKSYPRKWLATTCSKFGRGGGEHTAQTPFGWHARKRTISQLRCAVLV